MSTTSTIIPEVTKRIAWNKQTKDYDCFIAFDGEDEQPIGSASTYGDAEKKCRDYAFDYYSDNHTPEKAVQIALDESPTFTPPAAPTLRIEQLYYDQSKRGDLSKDAQSGPLAYVDYFAGAGDAEVGISFNVGGTHAPEIEMLGRMVALDTVFAALANLHILLADERVQQARVRYEAGAPVQPVKKAA